MSSAALPSWLGEIRAHGLIDGELIVDLGDGLTYVAYGLAPGEAPALVSPNAAAQRLAVLEKEVAPREGMRLVREFSTSPTCVCAIDIETQTLTPVDLPEGVTWAVDTTGGFWGLAEDGWTATWLDTRGEPRTKVLADDPRAVRLAERGAAAAMAYWDLPHYGPDHEAPVTDALLHVSTDRGQTWRVLRVPATVTRGDIDSRRLPDGWQNWPVAN